jgi:ketosteroid isomerase-like protein
MRSTNVDSEADRAAIRARMASIVAAHNAGDAETWASAATEDIVLMVDGGPSVIGRRASSNG